MSGNGIIEFHGSLIRADRVVYAEQVDNNVEVTVDAFDDEIIFSDCRLEDFRSEWRKAMNY